MILYTLKNKFYFNENNIFSGWEKQNIFGIGPEPSVELQYVVGLNLWYRFKYYPNKQ